MPSILLKRNTSAGNAPTANDLAVGELAINTADQRLFSKDGQGQVFAVPGIITKTSIDFLTSNSTSKSIEANIDSGTLSNINNNLYIPFRTSSGTNKTTLKLV
tara:strand:+ start:37 stop:345 length:309 start_codon:yes stop_codon:yes gene_type:complete